ncbi:MAG: hypothetical protein Tp156SUR915002_29 [Prokaryotic dsDNA virus sp.]|jgi:hypothetical protein|nr:MAG: hypothetical protein Tp162SUR384061_38 [Prokaryotic dsDNA virus sp.]QDP59768.1 MAG: hypothetical protein Tp156SUR915002_29 [Prokaryotic dsDNA virus sp.]|tara:strand:- start:17104 stop:17313 length:210 start_codon:yes stop_codon:yes gene_type:complete
MQESKAEKFKRLKVSRLGKLDKQLDLIANLGNKQNYDFKESDLDDIELQIVKMFRKHRKKLRNKPSFKL